MSDEKIIEETSCEEDDSHVSFEDLGLDEYTLKAVEKKGFITPSPIQTLAIPRLLNGDTNLIARARTGTGKTAAFGLPIIQSIREKSNNIQALILEPTRELAMQTCEEMKSFASDGLPRTTVLYGGARYDTQIKELKRGCEIVVGTPGRIKDHLERKTLDLSKIKYFILDEGDEMLDMGFIDDIRQIFEQANPNSRILLFSATMPAPILKIAADFMGEYDIIEEENIIDEPLLIDQKYWMIKESEKIEALVRLIDMSPDFYGLVFTMTKMDADNVTKALDLRGYDAAALHGDIMQNQREKVLERFRMKKTRILVATDVAARGIDISGLSHVVNYSLPFDTATYVHRIGRTGRAGTTGVAITFVRPEERRKLSFLIKNVSKATKGNLSEGKIPTVNEVLSVKEKRLIEELENKLFEIKNSTIESIDSFESNTVETDSSITEKINSQSDVENEVICANTTELEQNKSLKEVNKKYHELAEKLCKNHEPKEILASVLSVMYGEKLSPKQYGRISTKEIAIRNDYSRIYISLGKRDGYRAREIANYFSELLHIPSRYVDDIDIAQQFSLVSLPIASAKKAIELSRNNNKIPHMHYDTKEEGRGSRKSHKSNMLKIDSASSDKNKKNSKFDRNKNGKNNEKTYQNKKDGRTKGSRPNVHSEVQRSSKRATGGANAFLKKGKTERF